MLQRCLLLALFLFAPLVAAQDGATLLGGYKSALATWDQARVDAVRAQADLDMQHPARVWWPRFAAAAASGDDAAALGWMAANANFAFDPAPARGQEVRKALETLLARHPASKELNDGLAGLLNCREDLDESASMQFLARIAETAAADETRARALYTAAQLVSDLNRTADAKRRAEADELCHQVVLSYPKTKAAKEAAGRWHLAAEQRFVADFQRWLDEVEALRKAGKRYAEWPQPPLQRHVEDCRMLALTGHHTATRMCEVTWPSIDQAMRQGGGVGLSFLFLGLMQHYPPRAEGWDLMRPRILELALREFPGEPWAAGAFEMLKLEVDRMPPLSAEGPCRAALELHEGPHVRALAWWCFARTNLLRGDDAALGRARDALAALVDEHPDEDARWLESARADMARIDALRIGRPVPAFEGVDSEGQPVYVRGYKGRVVLLVVWSMLQRESLEALPDWVALQDSMQGRPFDIVGVSHDKVSRQADSDTRRKLGVRWRSIMTYESRHEIFETALAIRLPTTMVIDDEGVIRGRNLPWKEARALVERLVAEREAEAPAGGGR